MIGIGEPKRQGAALTNRQAQRLHQAFEERMLRQFQAFPGHRKPEEARLVNLGEIAPLPGPWRPFELKPVALDRLTVIPVPFKGPRMDSLAPFLPDGSQLDERPERLDTHLLLKFPDGGVKGLFSGLEFALGNCPDVVVAMRKPRATRMGDEDLQLAITKPVHQQPRTHARTPRAMYSDWHAKKITLEQVPQDWLDPPSPATGPCG